MFWKDIKVGDILRIEGDQQIPADCVILQTSSDEQNCFVSTMNLDGETNLKVKKAAAGRGRSSMNLSTSSLDELNWDKAFKTLVFEEPNPNIYKFKGFIAREENSSNTVSLDTENLLLRGCILR